MKSFITTSLGIAAVLEGALAKNIPSRAVTENIPRDTFSFESWVDSIIANPDGDHLSPAEAVKAANSNANSVHVEASGYCNHPANPVANADDAVVCINQLAAKGDKTCEVKTVTRFCHHGNANIIGALPGDIPTMKTTCQDIARAAGKVMDICYRADNTVEGYHESFAHPKILVTVLGNK